MRIERIVWLSMIAVVVAAAGLANGWGAAADVLAYAVLGILVGAIWREGQRL